MRKPKFIRIFIISLAVLFTAQACNLGLGGGGGGERVELIWWKPFDDQRIVNPLIEQFHTAHPNIRVSYVQKQVETYEDELIDALAAARGPDIFSIHNDWLPKHKDKIAPIPEKIFSMREFRDSFVEAASLDLVDEGKIYAVPLAVDVLALYYNKDILSSRGIARPPATWRELVDMTPTLTRQDNLGNFTRSAAALGTADNINRAPDILSLLMLQNGTPIYSQDRRSAALDQAVRDSGGSISSPGVRALEFYTQFANPAKVTYTWNNRSNNSIEAFASGQVAMIFSYSYLKSALTNRAPFLNYAIAGVPQIEEGGLKVNFANYWGEAIAKQGRKQEAAAQFLKFISSSQVLPKYYEIQKQPSSRIDILEKQIADPEIGVFAENALSAKSMYEPESDAVEKIFVQMINDVVLRSTSPQEAISAAAKKLNLLLRSF